MTGTIKTIKEGEWKLEHTRYIDALGFLRDSFEMYHLAENGHTTMIPFMPPIKIENYSRSDPIKTTTDYTDEEYKEMFKREKSRCVTLFGKHKI